ncbi:hypothetical protein E5Q_02109 [Mixia osmundae IAM 14324]|uniref:Uncharacterized protein n=1 Tax=Mixia osmundae (strain CBS 9802 / IAM 14324 / JCM 22182 / KY 12970) TaxID=764103 RepID=G7DXZ5_MIXOS|nr:hypothetical protein E5Q_02109 [Mixia osmundae IAM 14324]
MRSARSDGVLAYTVDRRLHRQRLCTSRRGQHQTRSIPPRSLPSLKKTDCRALSPARGTESRPISRPPSYADACDLELTSLPNLSRDRVPRRLALSTCTCSARCN